MTKFDVQRLVKTFHFTDSEMVDFSEVIGLRADDEGMSVRFIDQKGAGAEEMSCGYARMHPGQYHLKHHHPNGEQVYFFLEGEGIVTLGDQEVKVGRGTVTFFPKNCTHSVLVTSDVPLGWVWAQSQPNYQLMGIEYDEPERDLPARNKDPE